MTALLAQYQKRSPRYILNTIDNSLIRMSGHNQTPWEENTTIRNVSLTGLAFTSPRDIQPLLGELIKIQFQVPGSEQMSCYGLVIRIEKLDPEFSLIAVQFHRLELAHRINLAQGLALRELDSIKSEKQKNENDIKTKATHFKRMAFVLVSLLFGLSLFAFLYLTSQ